MFINYFIEIALKVRTYKTVFHLPFLSSLVLKKSPNNSRNYEIYISMYHIIVLQEIHYELHINVRQLNMYLTCPKHTNLLLSSNCFKHTNTSNNKLK